MAIDRETTRSDLLPMSVGEGVFGGDLCGYVSCRTCQTACQDRTHCTENMIYLFLEMKLRGLVPNSDIHVSVSDLYIPRIGLPVWLQQIGSTIAHRYMNVEIGRQAIIILFWK
jgi:hypothetical protein